mgnify:CR=1 FL=1
MKETVFIGSDHAAYATKVKLVESLKKEFPNLEFDDLGSHDEKSVDYPDFAAKVGEKVSQGKGKGILLCGSGIGMAISANKINGVRAANVWDVTSARLSKEHNNSNILCLGARLTGSEIMLVAARARLKAQVLGDRHQKRVDLISRLERK